MAKQLKKLTGPFTVRVEVNYGWQTETVESQDEASELGRRYIAKWQTEGLYRLKDGANLFVNEAFTVTKTLKIFSANNKLVTNQVVT